MSKISIIDPDELDARIRDAVNDALQHKLPECIRKATKKREMNASQVVKEFSISFNMQQKLRGTGQIRFKQRGQSIIYERSELIKWLKENRVKKRKI